MSEPTEAAAFGTPFEAALEAAFAESGMKLEPSNPQPDIVEPEKKEDEAKEPEKVPETLDDLDKKEADDLKLPIDEDVPEPEPDDDVPDMPKAAGERFKQLRNEQKELKTKLNTIEQERTQLAARVKELEASTGTTEEVTKKLADYELQLSISKLEATDPYKKAVTEPLSSIASTASEIADKHDIDANKLLDAIALTDVKAQDEALEDLLAGINDRDKLKVYALAEQLPKIMAERDRLYENRDGALKELEARKAEEDQRTTAERAKERKVAVDLVESRVTTKIPFLTKSDKFNVVAVKEALAETDFDALDTTTKAYNAYAGRLLPQFAKAQADLMKEIETLSDELDKYRKTVPSMKGSSGSQPLDDANISFAERIERQLAGVA
jgi:hypothetical protein